MNATSRLSTDSDDCDLPPEFTELASRIAALPAETRDLLEPAFARVLNRTHQRRRVLALVQESLSQLRLDIKYLTFDLDMTKRERDELRKRLGHP